LRQRLGYHPQCLHHDDGILVRLTDTDEPILDLFAGIDPDRVEGMILDELADSALFALRFRQNAARSLLLPRGQAGKRAPLWLQRLRGRDLLQVARRHADFPVVVETFRECLHDHLDVPRLRQLLSAIRAGEVEILTRRAESPSPFAAGLLFSFTAAFMYQYDRVEPDGSGAGNLDRQLLEQLVASPGQGSLLDPRAVHQVDRRLRGLGMPPRTTAEMAEWLRRLGDLTPAELEGPMNGFVEQLSTDGLALRIELPRCPEPVRWISAEEAELYRVAFGLEQAGADEIHEAAATIFARFLDTHALVGLADVLARYPFERAWAERQLELWVRSGRAIVVQRGGDEPLQYSAPANFEQVQRGSLGLLRREVITCQPAQFADFPSPLAARPPRRAQRRERGARRGAGALASLAVACRTVGADDLARARAGLTNRAGSMSGLRGALAPGWRGEWAIRVSESSPSSVAGCCPELPPPLTPDEAHSDSSGEAVQKVAEMLQQRGASFATDLACDTGLSPSAVRAALWALARRSEVTNDHFDVVRRGGANRSSFGERERKRPLTPIDAAQPVAAARRSLGAAALGRPGPEEAALAQCMLLLQRYGVVSRELALMDPWLLPWRVLYEVFSRLELSGEVRRGYFVEGAVRSAVRPRRRQRRSCKTGTHLRPRPIR